MPEDQVKETFHYDHATDTSIIESVQDVEPVLDLTHALRGASDGYSTSRDVRHVAEIPFIIAMKWKEELGVDVFDRNHDAKVRALLNMPEWAYLRVAKREGSFKPGVTVK